MGIPILLADVAHWDNRNVRWWRSVVAVAGSAARPRILENIDSHRGLLVGKDTRKRNSWRSRTISKRRVIILWVMPMWFCERTLEKTFQVSRGASATANCPLAYKKLHHGPCCSPTREAIRIRRTWKNGGSSSHDLMQKNYKHQVHRSCAMRRHIAQIRKDRRGLPGVTTHAVLASGVWV